MSISSFDGVQGGIATPAGVAWRPSPKPDSRHFDMPIDRLHFHRLWERHIAHFAAQNASNSTTELNIFWSLDASVNSAARPDPVDAAESLPIDMSLVKLSFGISPASHTLSRAALSPGCEVTSLCNVAT